jgi:hypothetical protein
MSATALFKRYLQGRGELLCIMTETNLDYMNAHWDTESLTR